ncbi:SUMF1/EgtB/PvdO family nonheme iron enzyme [Streptomyces sp. AC154]|uniref:SUMF1/EgtB/PvdO family nonheme iron enzyme n=1 Tax=Streptomyces sp. AC154 TaxID=3143184 RepID=UPI003F7F3929
MGLGCQLDGLTNWRHYWNDHFAQHGTRPGTEPVGIRSPSGDSPLGASDMAGNVSQWMSSAYELYDPARTYDRWMHLRFQVRTTERFAAAPGYSNHALGFRCARTAPQGTSAG